MGNMFDKSELVEEYCEVEVDEDGVLVICKDSVAFETVFEYLKKNPQLDETGFNVETINSEQISVKPRISIYDMADLIASETGAELI